MKRPEETSQSPSAVLTPESQTAWANFLQSISHFAALIPPFVLNLLGGGSIRVEHTSSWTDLNGVEKVRLTTEDESGTRAAKDLAKGLEEGGKRSVTVVSRRRGRK